MKTCASLLSFSPVFDWLRPSPGALNQPFWSLHRVTLLGCIFLCSDNKDSSFPMFSLFGNCQRQKILNHRKMCSTGMSDNRCDELHMNTCDQNLLIRHPWRDDRSVPPSHAYVLFHLPPSALYVLIINQPITCHSLCPLLMSYSWITLSLRLVLASSQISR